MLQKINCKSKGYVVEADHPQERPAAGPQLSLQTSDRGQCKKVGPKHSNPKNEKYFEWWGEPYVSEPGDEREVDEKCRSKRETKATRMSFEGLENRSEQCRQRAGNISWPKQQESEPRGHLQSHMGASLFRSQCCEYESSQKQLRAKGRANPHRGSRPSRVNLVRRMSLLRSHRAHPAARVAAPLYI